MLLVDAIDDLVRRRRAGRDAHGARVEEPFRTKVRLGLDVVHARTVAAARVHELTRVVAVRAADDDDDVASARQLDGGVLTLLGRLADRVDEADVGLREPPSNQRDQVSHPVDRLRRLSGDADARMFLERQHILSSSTTSKSSRSSVSPRTSTWARWPMMTG